MGTIVLVVLGGTRGYLVPMQFLGLPVAVVQQLYINLEINCPQLAPLCDKSYYSTSKLVAAQVLSRMEHAIRYTHTYLWCVLGCIFNDVYTILLSREIFG